MTHNFEGVNKLGTLLGILGVLGTLVSAGVAGYNYYNQKNISEKNLDLQKENIQYQKDLQQQVFSREDSSFQRARADLEKAGYNPNILSSGAGAGSVVSTQAPQQSPYSAGGLVDALQHMSDPLQTYVNTRQASTSIQLMHEQVAEKSEQNKQQKIKTATELLNFAKDNGLSADIAYVQGIPSVTVGSGSKTYESGYELNLAQKQANLQSTRLQMDIDSQRVQLEEIKTKIAQEKNQIEIKKLKQQAVQAQNDINYKYELLEFNKEMERLRANNQISVDEQKKLLIQEQVKASKTERKLKIFNTIFGSTMKVLGLGIDSYKTFKPSSVGGSKIFGRIYN